MLSVVFSVLMAFKSNPAGSLLSGAIALVVLLILQYVSGKFCDALLRLNGAHTDSLASTTFPDGVAMLSKALGVAALLASIITAVHDSSFAPIPLGIAAFLVFAYLSLAAICPASLNFTIDGEAGEKGAVEEALAVLTFLVKALMRAVPAAFGLGVICATLLVGYACYQVAFSDNIFDNNMLGGMINSGSARISLIYSALLPVFAYLLFLLYYLLLALCRAVLAVPQKLDAAATREAATPDEQP